MPHHGWRCAGNGDRSAGASAPKLRELLLDGNEIGDVGAVALGGALFGPESLADAYAEASVAGVAAVDASQAVGERTLFQQWPW